ncbi:isochorismatase family protein [Streptomyces erythrochromogenes]|uniref:isochorismatase family protein n=1 Tax=Streptomyces erythrochromogenes TaxID=285574 RepID=UPI0036942287
MDLSKVTPYPMPDEAALPPSSQAWTVEPGRAALLILGMQPQFLRSFPATAAPGGELLANAAALRREARARRIPVVFGHAPGAGPDPDDPLVPERGDHVITYVRENAFLRSHLRRVLALTGRDQLLLCGLFAAGGVLLTAADARMHGIQPFVAADAVADVGPEDHALAIRWTAARWGVVRTTRTLIQEMAGP